MWCQCTTGGAQSRLGHLGHTAQRLRVAQVGAGLSRSLGALAAGEAQDLGWDVKGERIRPSPRAHPNPQAQAAHARRWPSPPCTRVLTRPWATDTPALRAARSALPCWWSGGPGRSAAPRTAAQLPPLACREEAGHQTGDCGAQGVSTQAPALGLYRTWLQGQALWKRSRSWWKSREPKGPSLAASNSAKKWVVRSGGPEDGADVSSKVRVMPPKVIFRSESGRMVSGWGVWAVLPEGTEASPGAPQSSRAALPSRTVALGGGLARHRVQAQFNPLKGTSRTGSDKTLKPAPYTHKLSVHGQQTYGPQVMPRYPHYWGGQRALESGSAHPSSLTLEPRLCPLYHQPPRETKSPTADLPAPREASRKHVTSQPRGPFLSFCLWSAHPSGGPGQGAGVGSRHCARRSPGLRRRGRAQRGRRPRCS